MIKLRILSFRIQVKEYLIRQVGWSVHLLILGLAYLLDLADWLVLQRKKVNQRLSYVPSRVESCTIEVQKPATVV